MGNDRDDLSKFGVFSDLASKVTETVSGRFQSKLAGTYFLIFFLLILLAAVMNELFVLDSKYDDLLLKHNKLKNEVTELRSEVELVNSDVGKIKQTLDYKLPTKEFNAVVTAYTPYYESTGKNPGHPLFNVTRSGLPGGFGVCAADLRYWEVGTVLYVKGLGYCVVIDSGGAIKGRARFDYMIGGDSTFAQAELVRIARLWGRRTVPVKVVGHVDWFSK